MVIQREKVSSCTCVSREFLSLRQLTSIHGSSPDIFSRHHGAVDPQHDRPRHANQGCTRQANREGDRPCPRSGYRAHPLDTSDIPLWIPERRDHRGINNRDHPGCRPGTLLGPDTEETGIVGLEILFYMKMPPAFSFFMLVLRGESFSFFRTPRQGIVKQIGLSHKRG